jgi:hypothetical protein
MSFERAHLKDGFLDTQDSREIKSILNSVYDKIEDTLLQREEKSKFKQEQETMRTQAQQSSEGFAAPKNPQ